MLDIETLVKKHVQDYLEKKADELIAQKVKEVEQVLRETSYSVILDAVAKVKMTVAESPEGYTDVRVKVDL